MPRCVFLQKLTRRDICLFDYFRYLFAVKSADKRTNDGLLSINPNPAPRSIGLWSHWSSADLGACSRTDLARPCPI